MKRHLSWVFFYPAVLACAETHSARKYKLDNPSLIAAYLLWVDTSAAMSEWWPIVFLCWCWHNIHVLECTLLILAHIHNSISSSVVLLSCWVDSEAEKLTGWHVSVLRFNSTQVFVLQKVGTVISSIFWPFSPTQQTKNGIYQYHYLFIL